MKTNSPKAWVAMAAILAMAGSAGAQAPAWKVHLEMTSGWTDPTGILVDSTGYAVSFEELRSLSMPRCANLDPAEPARAAKHIACLLKNVKPKGGEWDGRCKDDPRVKIFIQGAGQSLALRYPLEQSCRDVDPLSAVRELGNQLLELRSKPWKPCECSVECTYRFCSAVDGE